MHAIGIDLGTTNCVVAAINAATGPAYPWVLANRVGGQVTPSVIAFTARGVVVGEEARELQAAGEPVAAFFKRSMGQRDFIFEAPGGPYDATGLSAILLATLKADAEAALGQTVKTAVITVPAYFKEVERGATLNAGAKAGLDVLQVINEPTAAAIAYAAMLGASGQSRRLVVYDLGGGTFDVTVLEVEGPQIRILGSGGDNRLGGKDWDDWIVRHAAMRFADEHGKDPLAEMDTALELQIRAEAVKKKLSAVRATTITIVHEGQRGAYEITRDMFESSTAALIERTAATLKQVLADLGLAAGQIDGTLLVGGSTRMPAVPRLLEQLFARPPLTGVNVDHVVAEGAALVAAEHLATRQAGSVGGAAAVSQRLTRAIDVTNHSLGMISITPSGDAYLNAKILIKNKPIPCAESRPFVLATRAGGTNRLEVFLTQGESTDPQEATYIGLYVADNVPHQKGGRAVIDITYTYDLSGKVVVEGRVRDGGTLSIRVEPLPTDVPRRFRDPPPKAASREHVSVALAFDLSGSMSGTPLAEAKRAGHSFVRNLDLSCASVAVLGVADRTVVKLALCQDASQIACAIDALTIGEVGGGNAGHPFDELSSLMQRVDGARFGVVLADGIWSNQAGAIVRAHACHAAGIEIAAIGFGGADRTFLRQIASSDDASIFTTQGELGQVFSTIAQSLSETGGLSAVR
ncbi:MAG: heat-shock protein Hsp70 [Ralstonia sp.]|uniref:Hsp70 family protein n=1 Tax=Ralstonia sp. TaxID=54061 RepID=UPI00257E7BCC|nr:Hsp70 family protein [Ralstonia sp.]MBA4232482.1 heat-shock protein Hsp70 [Ralstonia sp.]